MTLPDSSPAGSPSLLSSTMPRVSAENDQLPVDLNGARGRESPKIDVKIPSPTIDDPSALVPPPSGHGSDNQQPSETVVQPVLPTDDPSQQAAAPPLEERRVVEGLDRGVIGNEAEEDGDDEGDTSFEMIALPGPGETEPTSSGEQEPPSSKLKQQALKGLRKLSGEGVGGSLSHATAGAGKEKGTMNKASPGTTGGRGGSVKKSANEREGVVKSQSAKNGREAEQKVTPGSKPQVGGVKKLLQSGIFGGGSKATPPATSNKAAVDKTPVTAKRIPSSARTDKFKTDISPTKGKSRAGVSAEQKDGGPPTLLEHEVIPDPTNMATRAPPELTATGETEKPTAGTGPANVVEATPAPKTGGPPPTAAGKTTAKPRASIFSSRPKIPTAGANNKMGSTTEKDGRAHRASTAGSLGKTARASVAVPAPAGRETSSVRARTAAKLSSRFSMAPGAGSTGIQKSTSAPGASAALDNSSATKTGAEAKGIIKSSSAGPMASSRTTTSTAAMGHRKTASSSSQPGELKRTSMPPPSSTIPAVRGVSGTGSKTELLKMTEEVTRLQNELEEKKELEKRPHHLQDSEKEWVAEKEGLESKLKEAEEKLNRAGKALEIQMESKRTLDESREEQLDLIRTMKEHHEETVRQLEESEGGRGQTIEELARFKKEHADLLAELDKKKMLAEEILGLTAKLKKAEEINDELKAQQVHQEDRLATVERYKVDAENRVDTFERELQEMTARATQAESARDTANVSASAELEEAKENLAELQRKMEEMRQKLSTADMEGQESRMQLEKAQIELEEERHARVADEVKRVNEHRSLEARLESQVKRNEEIKKEYQAADRQVDEVKQELAEKENELQAADEAVKELQELKTKHVNLQAMYQADKKELEKQMERLKGEGRTELERLRVKCEHENKLALESENDRHHQEISGLRLDIAKQREEIELANAGAKQREEAFRGLQSDLNAAEAQLGHLTEAQSQAVRDAELATQFKEQAEQELRTLKGEVQKLESDLKSVQERLKEKERAEAERQKEESKGEEEMKKMKKESEGLKDELEGKEMALQMSRMSFEQTLEDLRAKHVAEIVQRAKERNAIALERVKAAEARERKDGGKASTRTAAGDKNTAQPEEQEVLSADQAPDHPDDKADE